MRAGQRPRRAALASSRSHLCRRGTALQVVGLAAILLVAGAGLGQAQQRNVRHYTNADGLPQSQALSIFQDSRGYLWFGTYSGVARYDGADFTSFAAGEGLAGNVVRAIAETRDGRVLFGTDGGLTEYDGHEMQSFRAPGAPAIENVTTIVVDRNGSTWVGTESGLFRIEEDRTTRFSESDGLPAATVWRVYLDDATRLWVGTDAGLALRAGDRFEPVGAGIPEGLAVRAIVEPGPGVLWVGTEDGLYEGDGESFERVDTEVISERRAAFIVDGVVDAEGTVWLGTRGGVFYQDDDHRRDLITVDNGLSSDEVWALLVDRENNLWVGTDAGASKIVPGPFLAYTERDGLPNPMVRDIAEGPEGRIWLATRDGIGVRERDGSFWSIRPGHGPASARGMAIAALADGSILYGTPVGMLHWSRGSAHWYTEADGLPSREVMAIAVRSPGQAWIGTKGGLARWSSGRIEPVPGAARPEPLDILDLEEDLQGDLWIATLNAGLFRYSSGELEAVGEAQGIDRVALWSVGADPRGGVWVGTNGLGAYWFGPRGVVRLSSATGLVNDFVWQVLADDAGRVWLYTNQGLDRWDGVTFDHFDTSSGLADMEGNTDAALQFSNGELWFGTGKGLMRYMPHYERMRASAPPVEIQSIEASGERVALADKIVLPRSRNDVSLHVAGLAFRNERETRYRYRLSGPEVDGWSAPTADRRVRYANLQPGAYTFEVVAIDGDGLASTTPARVTLTIEPGVTETIWFRVLAGLTLLGAAVGGSWGWSRHVELERRRLQRMVTEQTKELSKSEQRFRTALRNSPTSIFIQDRELRYTWVHNPPFGLLPEEMIGRTLAEFLDDSEDARAIDDLKRHVLVHGNRIRRELRASRNGVELIFDITVDPLRDEDGSIIGATSSATDVTERRRLEQQLLHAQKLEAVGQLAGGVAHDFNNLLSGITGFAQLALDEIGDEGTADDDLRRIIALADRAASLTRQLLVFSRQQPLERVDLDLNDLIDDLSKMLRRMIGEDIELTFAAAEDLGGVRADAGQIEQILLNMAVNARDAMPDGGKLTIETGEVTLDEAAAATVDLEPGRYVVLSVTDTGCGMDPATRERVFEPFFTTKEVGKGTGLGLATVYGTVKQHHGGVSVSSEPGKGTTFDVFLPRIDLEVASERVRPGAEPLRGREHVLLVEDEEAVCTVVERMLTKLGYAVHAACGPAEAERIFAERHGDIDLLLTDIVMPGTDGVELYSRLSESSPGLKVLYTSGYTERAVGDDGILEGGVPYLKKPFSVGTLAEKVRSVLDADDGRGGAGETWTAARADRGGAGQAATDPAMSN